MRHWPVLTSYVFPYMFSLILMLDSGKMCGSVFLQQCLERKTTSPVQNNYFKLNCTGLWPGWSDPNGRAVLGVSLRSLDCWDCGFESHRRHRCLSLVSVVYCHVDVCASCWSLVQGSPTDCDVSECDRETSTMRSFWPSKVCGAMKKMV
jgi:hypothetical protein